MSSTITIGIHGAAGRMGQRLVALAAADDQLEVGAALESSQHPRLGEDAGQVAGVGPLSVPLAAELSEPVAVVIDFSVPAALPGVVAAHTLKPVIGVPCASSSSPANLDSLLSVVQMPPGVPVGGVGIGRGENAALLACRILGIADEKIQTKLEDYRRELEQKTLDSN